MRLWQKLRNRQLGVDFRRQHPAGPFVLDFYCPSLRLAIELDGGQHAEARNQAADRKRDQWLADRSVTVLRFWNSDAAQNITGVLEVIAAKIQRLRTLQVTPTRRWRADLPLSGGGGPSSRRGQQNDVDHRQ
jgi:very-short-patch-repair endonuclease